MAGLAPAIRRRSLVVQRARRAMTEGRADIAADIAARTDSYFTRTRKILERFGDKPVTYAIFLRRPVICAPRLMAEWIDADQGTRHRSRADVDA